MQMRKLIIILSIILAGCSTHRQLVMDINRQTGNEFYKSKSKKSEFIKHNRKAIIEKALSETIDYPVIIVERYNTIYEPYQSFFAVKSNDSIRYFKSDSEKDKELELYNKTENDLYTESFLKIVFSLYSNESFSKLQSIHKEEGRRVSHSSIFYIYRIQKDKSDNYKIYNFLNFKDFGLLEEELLRQE